MSGDRYYDFEGIVGCGKSTQSKLFAEELRRRNPGVEVLWTFEPGGHSEIAMAIRRLVQGTKFSEEMTPGCEMYLYAAARAQTLPTEVALVLRRGGLVVSDRSVETSKCYQGFGRGLGWEVVESVNSVAVAGVRADRVAVIDVPVEIGLARAIDELGDKFDSMGVDFFERVRGGYLKMAKLYPERYVVIDGVGTVELVARRVSQALLGVDGR